MTSDQRVCPASELPGELLLHIFFFGIGDDHFWNIVSFLSKITATCSRWRGLALMTRGLWSTISFQQKRPGLLTEQLNIVVIEAFLERSRDAPLHVTIECSDIEDRARLRDTFRPHWPRVQTLRVRVSGQFPPFEPPYYLLTALRSLYYDDSTRFAPQTEPHDWSIRRGVSYRLEDLTLKGARAPAALLESADPSAIKRLSVFIPYTEIVRNIIASCYNIHSLRLWTTPETPPVYSHTLKSLVLDGLVGAESLNVIVRAPALEHVSVFCPIVLGDSTRHSYMPATPDDFPSLRTLTLFYPNITRIHTVVVRLIRNNPSLVAVHLGDHNSNSPAAALEGLVGETSLSSEPTPGPRVYDMMQTHPAGRLRLRPEDAPNLRFLRISTPSDLYRDTKQVVALARITARLLEWRPMLRVEWNCHDLGEKDPASMPWLESRLPQEVADLRACRCPSAARFNLNLVSRPPPLQHMFASTDDYEVLRAPEGCYTDYEMPESEVF